MKPNIFIVDDLAPEDVAMLQALYSRSGESVTTHLEKVKQSGSGKFMERFYVGYNHKSIGDCGSTTSFTRVHWQCMNSARSDCGTFTAPLPLYFTVSMPTPKRRRSGRRNKKRRNKKESS